MLTIAIKMLEGTVFVLDAVAKRTTNTRDDAVVALLQGVLGFLRTWAGDALTDADVDELAATLKSQVKTK